jgi:hypothetical protein
VNKINLDVKMTLTTKPSPLRFYAMLLIGVGLVAVGIVLFMLLNNPAASPGDLSAVPVQVDFAAPKLTLEDLSGKTVSLDDYLGSVVLVRLFTKTMRQMVLRWSPLIRRKLVRLWNHL